MEFPGCFMEKVYGSDPCCLKGENRESKPVKYPRFKMSEKLHIYVRYPPIVIGQMFQKTAEFRVLEGPSLPLPKPFSLSPTPFKISNTRTGGRPLWRAGRCQTIGVIIDIITLNICNSLIYKGLHMYGKHTNRTDI